jgi:Spy/CpxP family protein refolding chaperone
MKRNFWICLLVFSLALNLGGLATYTYMRYENRAFWREPTQQQSFQEMWGPLNLEPGQKQALGSLLPEHRRQVRNLRAELAQKRFELLEMTKEGTAAWPAIQEKVREVSILQGKLEEEVLRFTLAFQAHLKPEQKVAFITFVERRMPNVQGGKGRRLPRWEKGMGAGAPQADGSCGP